METVLFQHQNSDDRQYLSLYAYNPTSDHPPSPVEPRWCLSFELPISTIGETTGNECNGLYFFTNFEVDFVICNPSLAQFKPLHLPFSQSIMDDANFHACGIGYDPNSGSYKVVLAYSENYSRRNRAVVYSLDSDEYTAIHCPDEFSASCRSVYIGHVRYWTAMTNTPVQEFKSFFIRLEVAEFDFSTNAFTIFPLPPYPADYSNYRYELLNYRNMLGAIGYKASEYLFTPTAYDFWVRKGDSWSNFHMFTTSVVERPLGFMTERFLCLESPCSNGNERGVIQVYDMLAKSLSGVLDVCGSLWELDVWSYNESPYPLVDGQPMIVCNPWEEERKKKGKNKKNKKKKNKKNGWRR